MTKALEEVLKEVAKLPESEQDAIAALIQEEMESERKWDELFSKSLDKLEKLAEEARAEHKAGLTRPLIPDEL